MNRGINLLVIALVFVLGAAIGYAVGYGVWAVTPSQVAQLQERAQHFTEKAFGVASDHATSARQGG
jgi:uncharacterized membrane protein